MWHSWPVMYCWDIWESWKSSQACLCCALTGFPTLSLNHCLSLLQFKTRLNNKQSNGMVIAGGRYALRNRSMNSMGTGLGRYNGLVWGNNSQATRLRWQMLALQSIPVTRVSNCMRGKICRSYIWYQPKLALVWDVIMGCCEVRNNRQRTRL